MKVIHPEILADVLTTQAKDMPDKTALIFEGKQWTYSELDEWCNQAANAFESMGVKQGDRIAWLATNIASFWCALFGAAKIGAVLTPLNWRLAPAEISQILENAQASLLITQQDFVEPLGDIGLAMLVVEGQGEGSFEAALDKQSTEISQCVAKLDDPILQLYTSGTTGLPKGVELSNRCFCDVGKSHVNSGALAQRYDDERVLNSLPHFHIAGVGLGLAGLKQGMAIIQHREFNPVAIVEAAQGQHPIGLFLVPAMISMVLETAKKMGQSLEQLATVSYGAAPMPESLLNAAMQAMPNARFNQFYGMTETTGGLSVLIHEDHALAEKRRSAGKPLVDCEVKIIDPDTQQEAAVGEVGEVVARMPYIMNGYWNNPGATAETVKDGWYYSGDAGRLDEDGFLYVVDRIKDMVISGGENIYPAELENTLSKHPAVLECAIIGQPDEKWGEIVRAFVVIRPGEEMTADEVKAYLQERIAKFKLPRIIDFLDALPRNPSGKILKTTLRKM